MTQPLLVPARFLMERQDDWNDGHPLLGPESIAAGLAPNVREAIEVMVTGGSTFDRALVESLPKLALVACFSTGIEAIDTDLLRSRGIALTSAAGVNAHDVADHAMALFLANWHRIIAADAFVRNGGWIEPRRAGLTPRRSLRGKRAGIVGLGRIGSEIAARAAAHAMEVQWWGPRAKPDAAFARAGSLGELAKWADVLFLAAAPWPDNTGMIDAKVIEAVGSEGHIVNITRGSLIDEPALRSSLANGQLGGASLDVFEGEPIDGSVWADIPNVVMSPHVAGYTREAGPDMFGALRENIRRHFAGEPLLTPYFT